jgi:hypothetical protein
MNENGTLKEIMLVCKCRLSDFMVVVCLDFCE